MTGLDLRQLRRALGLGVVQFGYAIGFKGNQNTVSVEVREMEAGKKPVPAKIANRARELRQSAARNLR